MAKLKGLDLSGQKVRQTIDLKEVTGISFRGERALRLAIAQAVIDYIVARTQDAQIDVNGRPFKKYSKAYAETTDFKLLGKSTSEVNLTATGSMLQSIDVLKDAGNVFTIGFTETIENKKAHGHQTGFEGEGPKREFFGVTDRELKELIREQFKEDIDRLKGRDPGRVTVRDILGEGQVLTATDAGQELSILVNTIEDFNG